MNGSGNRTPERLLIIGCKSFPGIDYALWEDQKVPNISDYDRVIISVPHITKKFLTAVKWKFFSDMKKAIVQFLYSEGKMIVLVPPMEKVNRPSKSPEWVSNLDWSPISFQTVSESGRSIVIKSKLYEDYLKKMVSWSYYFKIPSNSLSIQLTNFYGRPNETRYNVPLLPYLENRYGRTLAGEYRVEITRARIDFDPYGGSSEHYPDQPDNITGNIVLLPLIDRMTPEEALGKILDIEIGYTFKSPEPDWSHEIKMPLVPQLSKQISESEAVITGEKEKIKGLSAQVNHINSFRRLLYGTGSELEDAVKKSFEALGAKVSPTKYSQEEYILEFDGQEFLMEVKGVSKSISLTHLRQLNDYLLKYEEDTGKEGKGILFGNAWRTMPPEFRGKEDSLEFPDNVIKRAEQWGISLVSSKSFFEAFIKSLSDDSRSKKILSAVTMADGIVQF